MVYSDPSDPRPTFNPSPERSQKSSPNIRLSHVLPPMTFPAFRVKTKLPTSWLTTSYAVSPASSRPTLPLAPPTQPPGSPSQVLSCQGPGPCCSFSRVHTPLVRFSLHLLTACSPLRSQGKHHPLRRWTMELRILFWCYKSPSKQCFR